MCVISVYMIYISYIYIYISYINIYAADTYRAFMEFVYSLLIKITVYSGSTDYDTVFNALSHAYTYISLHSQRVRL